MGRIAGCNAVDPINKDGSPGISEGNYEDADFKVAVFGDSFSVFVDDRNKTWVSRLQTRLQEKLGRSVHILNFARDGSGLLQMFDVAAFELTKWKPDLAIIAFNTDPMMEARIWRVAKSIAGEPRALTTFNQTENPNLNDPNSVYDTVILDSDIDADWCEKNKKGGELDRVGRDIVDKYLRFRAPRYSAFTLSRSFFWNRVVHADAFYAGGKGRRPYYDDIANDLKFENGHRDYSRKWHATVARASAIFNGGRCRCRVLRSRNRNSLRKKYGAYHGHACAWSYRQDWPH